MDLNHTESQLDEFRGRSDELAVMERAYASGQMEFYPVYGRRRVGKTELILHFIRNKPSMYVLGKKAPSQMQILELLNEAAIALKQPLLASISAETWQRAFELISQQIPTNRKFVLVLDEFQWMVEASPELPSVLQGFLDQIWKKSKNIFLIVCGSYMGFMEREVLGEKSPLFGRRTGQIFLKPFSFREAAQFHSSWSLADNARVYGICGGVPLYLQYFSRKKSILKNIEDVLLNPHAPLFYEPDFLLREELRELQKYYGIMMSLARGSVTSREISRLTQIDEKKIYYYMQNLIELGYVSRCYPLTTEKPSIRDVRFILKDPLLCFWFRFVFPHQASIVHMGAHDALQNLIKPQLDAYFGGRFEELCREALPLLYKNEGIYSEFEVGEYWSKETQIDVVGIRSDIIDIGECKWGKTSSSKKLSEELMAKIENYPNPKNKTIQPRLFVREKIKSVENHLIIHDLNDLYGKD